MREEAADLAEEDGKQLVLTFSQRVLQLQRLLDASVVNALAGSGLTRADLDVLGALHDAGSPYELRPKELSARLLITTGGMSNVIRRLESQRFVSRVPDADDGRGRRVRLTAAGLTIARQAGVSARDALARDLSGVPRETLQKTLCLLNEVMQAASPRGTVRWPGAMPPGRLTRSPSAGSPSGGWPSPA